MPWALLWKFRKYVAIIALLATFVTMFFHLLHAHDARVVAETLHKAKVDELNRDQATVDSMVANYDRIIDSLKKNGVQSEQEKTKVREHQKELVKVQVVGQSEIDSFIKIARDSAVKVVVDSVDQKYRSLLVNMGEQVASANALADMAESNVKNRDEIIRLREDEIAGLNKINQSLLEAVNTPNVNPPKPRESVGHFVIHKLIPFTAAVAITHIKIKL